MAKKIAVISVVVLLAVSLTGTAGAQSRMNLKNDVGIELLGKGLVYTFTYQYMIANPLGIEVGFGMLGGGSVDDNATIMFIPVGGKFYLVPKNGSIFLAGGVTILSASIDSGPFSDSASSSYGYAGLGFEYRSDGGFLFRGAAYGLIAEGGFFIWPGLQIGYAF
ncbi:hypothetical protein JXO52_10090 [bacterium]|nr:hypothetical protein [bacterium]